MDGKPYVTLGYANGVGYHQDGSDGYDLELDYVSLQPDRLTNLDVLDTQKSNNR